MVGRSGTPMSVRPRGSCRDATRLPLRSARPGARPPWLTSATMSAPDLRPLVGCQITQITLDYRVTLLLASQDGGANPSVSAWLTMGAPFILKSGDGSTTVTPDALGNYDRVPRLLGVHVEAAAVEDDLSLVLAFSDGTELVSARTPTSESWELGGRASGHGSRFREVPDQPPTVARSRTPAAVTAHMIRRTGPGGGSGTRPC